MLSMTIAGEQDQTADHVFAGVYSMFMMVIPLSRMPISSVPTDHVADAAAPARKNRMPPMTTTRTTS